MQGMMHSAQGVQWAVFSVWCVLCNASIVVCNVWWVVQWSIYGKVGRAGQLGVHTVRSSVFVYIIHCKMQCTLYRCIVQCYVVTGGRVNWGREAGHAVPRAPNLNLGFHPAAYLTHCTYQCHEHLTWSPDLVPAYFIQSLFRAPYLALELGKSLFLCLLYLVLNPVHWCARKTEFVGIRLAIRWE